MPTVWCFEERVQEVTPSFLEYDWRGRECVGQAAYSEIITVQKDSVTVCRVHRIRIGAAMKRICNLGGPLCGLKKCGTVRGAFPWIGCENGKLGCKLCSEISCLGAFTKERIAISKKWYYYNVTYNVLSRATQLTTIRKKISEHKQSTADTTAERKIAKGKKQILENVPYSNHFGLLELQQLNCVDIGVGLHSRYNAVEITDHISKEMKSKIIRHILEIPGELSVIIDESTSLGAISTLIVYLKCGVSKELPPSFLFLDLIELPDQKSETVFEHLLNCLNKHCFHDHYLKENFVAFASVGATWHCMNHRLELALNNAVDKVGGVNNLQIFMNKLNNLYNNSPKNQHQLAELQDGLPVHLAQYQWSGRVSPPCIIIFPHQKMTKVEPGNKCLEARVTIKSGSVHTNSKQEEYDTLRMLEGNQWSSEKPPGFGDIEIERLCWRFKLTASKIRNGYHDYLEDSSLVSKELNLSFNCIKLIPCSSAECERGFSQMSLTISHTRNRITIPHVSSLGPALRE
ncbi:hypothetical protein PR048_030949 [Dryococelus australis]|uniref:Uncharacterized protein n=1 Tax=Dryococelus australis TaxID=614101 RepID=A0ABQ9GAS6_9NEOP|nr:hypothetical protein PR048_030949 [Dryococelus australis]